MSSNAERGPKVGPKEKAEEVFLLEKIGERAPSSTQAVKVCKVLGLASRENIRRVREIAKNEDASKAKNKKSEERAMEVKWGSKRYFQKIERLAERILKKTAKKMVIRPQYILCHNRGWWDESPLQGFFSNRVVISVYVKGGVHSGLWRSRCFVSEGEFSDIVVSVAEYSPAIFAAAKKFAKEYEKLTGKSATVLKNW